ncbi:alpha/beta hydrolase [Cellulomonas endophytica]|uniref:alpha/beta hydrolase n=1 Tax=Cellulomonas endophytica TaxID=2494735 RepID=UPI00196B4848|nr:hypothetical protein [Cellulomonas endophytica]
MTLTTPPDAAPPTAPHPDATAGPDVAAPGSTPDATPGTAPDGRPVAAAATRTWTEPEGLTPRGTVVVLVGRGETPEVYERLGRRLAADAYRVLAVDEGRGTRATVEALLADADLPSPRVLLGSDAGALTAVTVARSARPGPDALVLAGLPTRDEAEPSPFGGTWEREVEARTACPNHRAVLGRAARSSLAGSLLATAATGLLSPSRAARADLDLPVLAVHGAADAISPVVDAVPVYRALGALEVVVVEDGLHDVLNDVQHRTVAATVVLFLERLRLRRAQGRPADEVPAPLTRDALRGSAA